MIDAAKIEKVTAELAGLDRRLGRLAAEYNARMAGRWTQTRLDAWFLRITNQIQLLRRSGVVPTAAPAETPAPAAPAETPAPATPAEIPVGIYWAGGKLYRVRLSRAGRPYAQGIRVDKGGKVRFSYAPGVIRSIRITGRVSEGDAAKFGIQVGQCICCGRELTAPESVREGIGPICRAKYF